MKNGHAAVSVCIVSHNAYGAISGGRVGFVGGVERQTSLLACWLADHGYRVSLITWDEGGPREEEIRGVRVIKICGKQAGVPGLRFFYPKWTGLIRAMRRAAADVYYQNCGECVTGQMALWCRAQGKPFVFSVASDADCHPSLPELRTKRERALFRYGLKRAQRRVTQTESQRMNLRRHFDVDSEVIPMPAPGPSDADYQPPDPEKKRVLWVGRVCRVKRPELLMEVAAACPDIDFWLAGPLYDDAAGRAVGERASNLPNLRVLGAVAREAMPALFRDASLLCCTSQYEGFPNTFVEAWSHGLPVVSSVDPDGLIVGQGLGLIGSSSTSLADGIRRLFGDRKFYSTTSVSARAYYVDKHAMDVVMPRFGRLFDEISIQPGECDEPAS